MKIIKEEWKIAKSQFDHITRSLPKKLVSEDPDLGRMNEIIEKNRIDIYRNADVCTRHVEQGSKEIRKIYLTENKIVGYPHNNINYYYLHNNYHYDESSKSYLDTQYIGLLCQSSTTRASKYCKFEIEEHFIKKSIKYSEDDGKTEEVIYYDLEGNKVDTRGNRNCKALVKGLFVFFYI